MGVRAPVAWLLMALWAAAAAQRSAQPWPLPAEGGVLLPVLAAGHPAAQLP